ncbi:MAG: molybdenum-binding protein, partial [Bacteroidetes bacterium]|nr:molybdenum-binding protein [Bacteroidota bacterium]
MKPPKSSKNDVFLRYKLWLSAVSGEGIVGESTHLLLRKIEEMGSLKAAAEFLGISYRKAWGDIKKSEE